MSSAFEIAISRCHFPVTGLGFGRRTGIWLQGCSIRCPGCIVPETWQPSLEHRVPLARLLQAVQPWVEISDGVTISGGEPFDQPEALFALLTALRVLTPGDLLVYSGYPWRKLRRDFSPILQLCDVVVSEPFRARQLSITPLTGSSNQRVHLLSPAAKKRYADWRDFPSATGIAIGDNTIQLVGILPRQAVSGLAQAVSRLGPWEASLTNARV